MGMIKVDSDAYTAVTRALNDASEALNEATGKIDSAVSSLAFGPIAAFIPPGFNSLGALIDGATTFVAARATVSAGGIATAVSGIADVDDAARTDFDNLIAELP